MTDASIELRSALAVAAGAQDRIDRRYVLRRIRRIESDEPLVGKRMRDLDVRDASDNPIPNHLSFSSFTRAYRTTGTGIARRVTQSGLLGGVGLMAVASVPGYGAPTVAEFAFALLLALSRKRQSLSPSAAISGSTAVSPILRSA